ncbi:MAG: YebC/PmpR family DNA-binding transcriptional regulator [Candidatus Shapirobacteria bacterium]|nr:YebC/PmpR family DNA-binding transcriptional regulator [Candidatus Shapirobacteria bacterium]
MSGHSKWDTIKRQKESKDIKKGQVFTKLAKAITIAVRAGGGIGDPEKNFKLRLAVDKARNLNMPKENIQRAILKGEGEKDGANWFEVTYEGYGPEGIAIIIEAATDNKNRTTSEIKNIFERAGGTLASPGAVVFQFKKTGLLTVEKNNNPNEQILSLMDLDLEDIQETSDVIEIYTKPEQTREVRNKIENLSFKVLSEELIMKPLVEVKINDQSKAGKILKIMETFEDHDDIQKVFSNFDIPDEMLG